MKRSSADMLVNILAGIGAAAIGAASCWVGKTIIRRFKKKYGILEVTERGKEETEP